MGVREYLQSRGGKNVAVGIAAVGILVAIYSIWSNVKTTDEYESAMDPVFMCAETNKTFHVHLTTDLKIPAYSKYSGKNTAYPTEMCFWTKDGQIKDKPTYVLLNTYRGKPDEPTFCPDCGRLVVSHNPSPRPGGRPPPTEAEWKARHTR